ncbi:MAG: insulinase family protein [Phycisphaerales bacterium]|nr:MAG: insulinase family protein [Phycisphaerales bacterium]
MPVEFRHETLPNGLTIIAEVDPEAHSAASGFFVRTGARDEPSEVMGVSHFLEHMMFKGTARRSAEDVNREFDEIGANYNAYTSSEITCFHAQVLPERLGQANDILADILRPALRESDFDTEKGVILEEIAMYRDEPFWVLYERVVEERYNGAPLAHRVLGTNETVGAMTQAQMRAYFEQRYSADNTVVALAGKIDFEACVEQFAGLCKDWRATKPHRDTSAPPPRAAEFVEESEQFTRAYWIMLAQAPALEDDRRYAAAMLAHILGGPANSRLHWALLETGLAEEAQAAYDPHDGCGDYFVYASCDPARADEVRTVIDREIEGLIETVSEQDLERLRNKSAAALTLAGERPGGRMQRIGRLWTYLHAHRTLEEELDAIMRVTLDDVRAVHEAFPFSPRCVGLLRPKA